MKGDKDRAEAAMSVEETAFETHKDFTQLLTDAAMKPESTNSSASTQKFSLSLCKEGERSLPETLLRQTEARFRSRLIYISRREIQQFLREQQRMEKMKAS